MPSIKQPPRVLIVAEPNHRVSIDSIRGGAERAGWQAIPFDNIELAIEEFDISINALITELGVNDRLPHRVYGWLPQSRLLDISDYQGVPRALISSHPLAKRYIRPNSSDEIIPKSGPEGLSPKVAQWLINLYKSNIEN